LHTTTAPPTTCSQAHIGKKIGSSHNREYLEEAQHEHEPNAPLVVYVKAIYRIYRGQ